MRSRGGGGGGCTIAGYSSIRGTYVSEPSSVVVVEGLAQDRAAVCRSVPAVPVYLCADH